MAIESEPEARHPYFHPYNPGRTSRFEPTPPSRTPRSAALGRLQRKSGTTTQIYEGTNQIQRVVIAKRLLS